ncbi:hypothetical protein PMAN_a1369 [Pseudoalteromonas marina]|nr:hypothetical protein PMAN_a1369 [Pseudoalteromonas marina]
MAILSSVLLITGSVGKLTDSSFILFGLLITKHLHLILQ